MTGRIILSLCDHSGNWPAPYREAGYDIRQVDLKHGQDVRLLRVLQEPIHGILAATPCTVFAASGNRWKRAREEIIEGLSVVDACLRLVAVCHPTWWALENPRGKLRRYLGPPRMIFDPCQYGDPYTKKTLLWGSFTPPVPLLVGCREVEPVLGSYMHTAFGGKSERTKELRSATPMGFARAFYDANR
jgi:hypothetical protein